MKNKQEEPNSATLTFRLPESLRRWIEERAKERRWSRGSFVKHALADLRAKEKGRGASDVFKTPPRPKQ